jgi:thioredoxin 1
MFKHFVAAISLVAAGASFALEIKPFAADQLAAAQSAGKPVAVHFHADWCPTCVAQSKSIDTLKADLALKNLTLLVANYDNEKELRKAMKVRAQSTFVVFKGKEEVGRIAGETDAGKIKAGLAKAL